MWFWEDEFNGLDAYECTYYPYHGEWPLSRGRRYPIRYLKTNLEHWLTFHFNVLSSVQITISQNWSTDNVFCIFYTEKAWQYSFRQTHYWLSTVSMGLQVTRTALTRLPRLPGFWLENIYLPDGYYDHKHELVKACDIVLLEFSTDELLDVVLAGEVQALTKKNDLQILPKKIKAIWKKIVSVITQMSRPSERKDIDRQGLTWFVKCCDDF